MLTQMKLTELRTFLKENQAMYFEDERYKPDHFIRRIRFEVLDDELFFENLHTLFTELGQYAGDNEKNTSILHHLESLYEEMSHLHKKAELRGAMKANYRQLARKDGLDLDIQFIGSRTSFRPKYYSQIPTKVAQNKISFTRNGKQGVITVFGVEEDDLKGFTYAIGHYLELAEYHSLESVKVEYNEKTDLHPVLVEPMKNLLSAFGFCGETHVLDLVNTENNFIRTVLDFKTAANRLNLNNPSFTTKHETIKRLPDLLPLIGGAYHILFSGHGCKGVLALGRDKKGLTLAFQSLYGEWKGHLSVQATQGESLYSTLLRLVDKIKETMAFTNLLNPPNEQLYNLLHNWFRRDVEIQGIAESFIQDGYTYQDAEDEAARLTTDYTYKQFQSFVVPKELIRKKRLSVKLATRFLDRYLLVYEEKSTANTHFHYVMADTEAEANAALTKKINIS